MVAVEAVLGGPLGAFIAILAMATATYLCRIGGVLVMSRVRITPGVERALAALPGSIVAATVVPIALKSGLAGIVGVTASILTARLVRNELLALVTGLASAAAIRALGF